MFAAGWDSFWPRKEGGFTGCALGEVWAAKSCVWTVSGGGCSEGGSAADSPDKGASAGELMAAKGGVERVWRVGSGE